MKNEWPGRFNMIEDPENKRLKIIFKPVPVGTFEFSGVLVEGDLSVTEIITRVLKNKNIQTRFSRKLLDDKDLLGFKNLEQDFFLETSPEFITFTPRFDSAINSSTFNSVEEEDGSVQEEETGLALDDREEEGEEDLFGFGN